VAQLLGCPRHSGTARSTAAKLARRAEERGGMNRMEREGEALSVELATDKVGRGRSAAHVEVVLHGQRVVVGGRWRDNAAARGERGDEATHALG
jgi:hypothetical protein